jgi:hypothetical protein
MVTIPETVLPSAGAVIVQKTPPEGLPRVVATNELKKREKEVHRPPPTQGHYL